MALNLFRTKSPEHLMAETAAPERQLKRALSAFDSVVNHYNSVLKLKLTEQEKNDLIEYFKTMKNRSCKI